MTTKEKIIDEALTLFSTKGYQGTSVKNIADAVGIKDSSLYKHYKSKKEIFDTIVLEMSMRIEGMSRGLGLPGEENMEKAAFGYGQLTAEGLWELSKNIYLYYLRDEFAARFRRMLTIEQFRDREIYEVYRKIFMEDSITYQTQLFGEMIRQGIFIEANPAAMAVNFYAPVYFLLNKYDQEWGREDEALVELKQHVEEFGRIYLKKDRNA